MAPKTRTVDETQLTRAWIDWLVDTRQGYLEALLGLPRKERLRDRGASFPSMQDIFLHILDNNAWWFDSVPNGRQESHHAIQGSVSDAELRRQARRIARSSRRLARSLTPARLNRRFVVRGTRGDGKPFELRMNLRTIIWHMVEEELQHRGELNALFWQQDVDAPTRAWFSSALAE
jgi:uncharacterized damage-inducible protein DinB